MGHKLFANESTIDPTLFRVFPVTVDSIPSSWLFYDQSPTQTRYLQQRFGQNLDATTRFRYGWKPLISNSPSPDAFNWMDPYYAQGGSAFVTGGGSVTSGWQPSADLVQGRDYYYSSLFTNQPTYKDLRGSNPTNFVRQPILPGNGVVYDWLIEGKTFQTAIGYEQQLVAPRLSKYNLLPRAQRLALLDEYRNLFTPPLTSIISGSGPNEPSYTESTYFNNFLASKGIGPSNGETFTSSHGDVYTWSGSAWTLTTAYVRPIVEAAPGYSDDLWVLIPDSFVGQQVDEIYQLPDQSIYFRSAGLAAFGQRRERTQGYMLLSYNDAITVNTQAFYPGYKVYVVKYGINGIKNSSYSFVNHSASTSYKAKRERLSGGSYQWSPGSAEVVYEQWFKTSSDSSVKYILPDTFNLVERDVRLERRINITQQPKINNVRLTGESYFRYDLTAYRTNQFIDSFSGDYGNAPGTVPPLLLNVGENGTGTADVYQSGSTYIAIGGPVSNPGGNDELYRFYLSKYGWFGNWDGTFPYIPGIGFDDSPILFGNGPSAAPAWEQYLGKDTIPTIKRIWCSKDGSTITSASRGETIQLNVESSWYDVGDPEYIVAIGYDGALLNLTAGANNIFYPGSGGPAASQIYSTNITIDNTGRGTGNEITFYVKDRGAFSGGAAYPFNTTITIRDVQALAGASTIAAAAANVSSTTISSSSSSSSSTTTTTSTTTGTVNQNLSASPNTVLTSTYSLMPSAWAVKEGQPITITLTTANVVNGTSFGYTITGVSAADLGLGSLSGSFIVTNNQASVTFNVAADAASEGTETCTIALNDFPRVRTSFVIQDTSVPVKVSATAAAAQGVAGVSVEYDASNIENESVVAATNLNVYNASNVLQEIRSGTVSLDWPLQNVTLINYSEGVARIATALETIASNSTTMATNSTTIATNTTTIAALHLEIKNILEQMRSYQEIMKNLAQGSGMHVVSPYETFGITTLWKLLILEGKILEDYSFDKFVSQEEQKRALDAMLTLTNIIKSQIPKDF